MFAFNPSYYSKPSSYHCRNVYYNQDDEEDDYTRYLIHQQELERQRKRQIEMQRQIEIQRQIELEKERQLQLYLLEREQEIEKQKRLYQLKLIQQNKERAYKQYLLNKYYQQQQQKEREECERQSNLRNHQQLVTDEFGNLYIINNNKSYLHNNERENIIDSLIENAYDTIHQQRKVEQEEKEQQQVDTEQVQVPEKMQEEEQNQVVEEEIDNSFTSETETISSINSESELDEEKSKRRIEREIIKKTKYNQLSTIENKLNDIISNDYKTFEIDPVIKVNSNGKILPQDNKLIIEIEEKLMKLLINIDDISSNGINDIKLYRKQIVSNIQSYLDKIDTFKNKAIENFKSDINEDEIIQDIKNMMVLDDYNTVNKESEDLKKDTINNEEELVNINNDKDMYEDINYESSDSSSWASVSDVSDSEQVKSFTKKMLSKASKHNSSKHKQKHNKDHHKKHNYKSKLNTINENNSSSPSSLFNILLDSSPSKFNNQTCCNKKYNNPFYINTLIDQPVMGFL